MSVRQGASPSRSRPRGGGGAPPGGGDGPAADTAAELRPRRPQPPGAHEALIDQVGESFRGLRRAADRVDEAVALRFGLNRSDLRCLGILYYGGELTAGALAEASGLSSPAVSAALDRLERTGYAVRVTDPADRRRVVVNLTPAARELGARLYGQVEAATRARLEPLDEQQLSLIGTYLRDTVAAYEDLARAIAADDGTLYGGASDDPQRFTAPMGECRTARLEFTKGAARVSLSTDPGLRDLCRGRFEGNAPEVRVHDGTISVQQRRRLRPFDWRRQAADLVLGTQVPWEISLKGGLWKLCADLSDIELTALEVAGGASDIEVTLPPPVGVVPVRVSGGASKVTLRRPAGVAARAYVSGGAASLEFDGQRLGSVGGQSRLSSAGSERAADLYDIRFTGGASKLRIDTR